MPVIVNDIELVDADMEAELPKHQDAPDPMHSAMTALVLRRLMLDAAQKLELQADNEDALFESLLEHEVKVPTPSDEECLLHYTKHPERFSVGELVEANHILFQVTPGVDLAGLRLHADAVLQTLLADPSGFANAAKENSNCPSAEVGGNLGQLSRNATVPEFERALFAASANSIIPYLVETRFGLHIVQVGRKVAGKLIPFEEVHASLAQAMVEASRTHAIRQYLQLLVGQARISGIDLAGVDTPLVQ
jgi:peptidyl-prolyl cis-trans isomerase C